MREIYMDGYVLLGNEAVALGALHAGVSLAYGYPGTPSTEIIEYMQQVLEPKSGVRAQWCSNEKTAYEAAVGASAMNRRVLVTMKHVGLNVAADPFMNSAIMNIKGGLVLAVADDPGMHSSQNEQDSRFYADFAKLPCFEPHNQQEAYEMTRAAFDLSERFHVPVLLRLVTRLSHSRAIVRPNPSRGANPMAKFTGKEDFITLPATSRKRYVEHLELYKRLQAYAESETLNPLKFGDTDTPFSVITSGLGHNYFEENAEDLGFSPSVLHVNFYPLPEDKIRTLAAGSKRILCIEEGYPFIERLLRGILPVPVTISGKLDGCLPPSGELNPDIVRTALKLPEPSSTLEDGHGSLVSLPGRPPQLCKGCPHQDTFKALNTALEAYENHLVTGDIGCYTLGYLPPLEAIETGLCMGASITMARGAAQAGMYPVVAVIGDSTFMHSGLTGLADAVSSSVPITILILDNSTTAMTGGQDTIFESKGIRKVVLGLGVEPEHCVEMVPLPARHEENSDLLRREIEYKGVSVVFAFRECIQTAKRKHKKEAKA